MNINWTGYTLVEFLLQIHLQEKTIADSFCLFANQSLSGKGSTLTGKNVLTLEASSFLLEQTPLQQGGMMYFNRIAFPILTGLPSLF